MRVARFCDFDREFLSSIGISLAVPDRPEEPGETAKKPSAPKHYECGARKLLRHFEESCQRVNLGSGVWNCNITERPAESPRKLAVRMNTKKIPEPGDTLLVQWGNRTLSLVKVERIATTGTIFLSGGSWRKIPLGWITSERVRLFGVAVGVEQR